MKRRDFTMAGAACIASAANSQVLTQQMQASASKGARSEWVMATADGVSYKSNITADAMYLDIADTIGKKVASKVTQKKILSYAELSNGIRQESYDLCYVHPGHHAIRALASGNYRLVALSKTHLNYRVSFLVRADSQISRIEHMSGVRLLTPDADSITAWMTRAAIKDMNLPQPPRLSDTRYQEAIRFAVENKLVDVGATASGAEVKEWTSAGHRVIQSPGRAVPVKYWLLHKKHATHLESVASVIQSLTETSKISAPDGFVGFDERVLLEIGKWVERGTFT